VISKLLAVDVCTLRPARPTAAKKKAVTLNANQATAGHVGFRSNGGAKSPPFACDKMFSVVFN
jgi:hypothetical protein